MRKLSREPIEPTAILSADLHIRSTIPRCRTDDFLGAQERKVQFVCELAREKGCPILVAGDVGDSSQWPNWLLEWFISLTKGVEIIVIPGQHDLPNHRLDRIRKSALGVLGSSETVNLLSKGCYSFSLPKEKILIASFPYSTPLGHCRKGQSQGFPLIAMTHQMVIDRPLWPGQVAQKGQSLLMRFSEYKLILSGDNHQPFVSKYKDRILVNPGSFMRTKAGQIDHKPRVYFWWAKSNRLRPVFLPIEDDVVSREHVDQKEALDERLLAYVKEAKTGYAVGLDFQTNLVNHIRANPLSDAVRNRLWEFVDG